MSCKDLGGGGACKQDKGFIISFEGIWNEFFILRVSKLLHYSTSRGHTPAIHGSNKNFSLPRTFRASGLRMDKMIVPLLKRYFPNFKINHFPGVVSEMFRRNSLT